MPFAIAPDTQKFIENSYGKFTYLVLSHVPTEGSEFRTVTGYLARCQTIKGARRALKQTPNSSETVAYSIYDTNAKTFLAD